jgi:predicted transcriptional regulator
MIETLISSKTRIKLLMKFFLNSSNSAYLRGLEEEFQESTNSIRVELNRLEEANMLKSSSQGNKKVYRANIAHPLFDDVKNIVRKHLGIDTIIENVIKNLGNLESAYLTGALCKGLDSDTINIVLIGDVNEAYLQQIIAKSEQLVHRKIVYELLPAGAPYSAEQQGTMLLWQSM